MNSVRRSSGFTLIELMIVITILSLLLFTGNYSYSMLSSRWNKELGNYSQVASDAKHLLLVQNLLEGIEPLVVVNQESTPSFFFIGDKTSLLGVSVSGLFSVKQAEIFRLTAQENPDGLFDLIYQSASTKDILLTATNQEIVFTQKLTLFSALSAVEFSYYGWQHFDKKNDDGEIATPGQWFERFSGIDNQLMPTKMTLRLNRDSQWLDIAIELDGESESRLSPYVDGEQ